MGKMRRVAVLAGNDPLSRRVLGGISRYLNRHRYWQLATTGWCGHQPLRDPESFTGDGVIVIGGNHLDWVPGLQARGMPVVGICCDDLVGVYPTVNDDHDVIGQLAADHLLGLGLRHFAFCGSTPGTFVSRRAEAFRRHIEAAGFDCHVHIGSSDAGRWLRSPEHWHQGQRELLAWARQLPKPVGILASFDVCAIELLNACRAGGVRVPDEVAILGVDNDVPLCESICPTLSSIPKDEDRKGYVGAQLLDRLMSGRRGGTTRITIRPLPVVQRQSTTMLAISDPLVIDCVRLIESRLSEPISIEDLLDEVMVSRRTLETRFRATLGRTPAAEIRRLRIEKAKRLLRTSNAPISDIAAACGYPNQNRFAQAFRAATGTSPTGWRQHTQPARPNGEADTD